jgi:hypothetical protein
MLRLSIPGLLLLFSLQGMSQTNLENNMVFGGNATDEAKDLVVNSTNTALFFGARSFSTDGNVPGNAGGSDFWIMKRDVDGSLIWSKTFGSTGNDDLESVLAVPDGGAFGFGTTRTDQGLFGDILGLAGGWLMRTNNNGTIIDGRIFGGNITETAVDACRLTNGNITMAMESGSPVLNGQFNHGVLDVWIVQVNQALTTQWTSLLGGSGTDVPEAIVSDLNGNIYVAATSNSNLPGLGMNKGGTDIWVIKIAPDGQTLWQKTFGGSDDDVASDIVIHPDGYVYVLGHSFSNDQDFGINYGLNDLWMIKLDLQDGDTQGLYHYGGSGNDNNAHADFYGDDQIMITANSTSQDTNLTGNKGLSDVWMLNTDLNGNINYQMNYGGSLNDLAVDVVTIDSVFHVLSSSLSSDKNVPQNPYSQQDLWYYTLNPNPDTCSTQLLCQPDSNLTNHLYPPATDALICVNGCTAGYGPGPSFNTGSCPDFENPTAYFFVTTDTTADLLTLSVHSEEFNKPQIALLRSVNCQTFQQVDCAIGEFGNVVLPYIGIDPQTVYVVAISDADGHFGEFEFCATSIDVEFCNERDRIYVTATSMNSPAQGPYKPGEEVTICYELQDWTKLDCNGFQGLVPTFGPGWDSTSFDGFGQPIETTTLLSPATTGFWEWYQVGEVHYNVSNPINGYDGGQGMPAGWYFTNTADPPPATEPDETTGDLDNCLPTSDTWKVCFTLKVVEECETNLDCSVSMKTFSDGELGFNSSLACAYDQEEVLTRNMICCLNPGIEPIQNFSVCSGDTIAFAPETNILPPVTYSWTADPDPLISGATSVNNANLFYQILSIDAAIPLKVRYTMTAQGGGCEAEEEEYFEVTVLPRPTSRITISGPNIVCSGSTVKFNFESTGTPPFAIGLYRENEFFANVLSESNFLSIDIDPVFSGRFRIGTLQDANCNGQGTGFVNVTVKPVSTSIIDTTICEGESFFIEEEEFSESGTYSVTLENGAENNCDSTILLTLSVAPILTQTIDEVICNGDTLTVLGEHYTETIDTLIEYTGPEGCPNFIELHLLVKDTFTMDINQTICFGDTLEFGGIKIYQPGDYAFVEEVRPGCFEETILHLDVLPAIVVNDIAIIGDNGSNTGAIIVEIVGGSPPLQYLWNTGQTSESIFNVKFGEYKLTVTDRLGCDEFFTFNVPMISSTGQVENEISSIRIRPNILQGGQSFYLMNTGRSAYTIKGMTWWSMSGKHIDQLYNITLDAGASIPFSIPPTLIPGLYNLQVSLSNGEMFAAKIVVQE